MTDTSLMPGDVEAIAAFLDHQLSEQERRAFLERLDREPALYEVFVETVRFRESEQQGGELAHHPAGRAAWLIPGAVAAMLAIAIIGPFLLGDSRATMGSDLARALVDGGGLDAALGPEWYEQGWRRTRGLTPTRSEVDSAFRIGVHSVDLEIALRLGYEHEAERLLRYIDGELRKVDLSDHLRISYGEIRRLLEQDVPLERALEQATAIEPQAVELLDAGSGFVFGRWAEAGKLAARAGNEELLRSRAFRRMLEEIGRREWTPIVDRHLDEIATRVAERGAELDLAALETSFTAIIDES